ncbi:MAG: inositol monophosphatase, partial [Synechocystis sp.]
MAITLVSGGLFTISIDADMESFWTAVLTFCQSATTAIATELVAKFAKIPAERKADGTLVTAA